jgi:hypothetical protein
MKYLGLRQAQPELTNGADQSTIGVAGLGRSLFLPDIELARFSRNACAAGVFGVFGRRIAVIFENHPDIGLITGRRVCI